MRLPVNIYERLRTEAFEERVSQVGIIIEALSERYGLTVGEEAAEAPVRLKTSGLAITSLAMGEPDNPNEPDEQYNWPH